VQRITSRGAMRLRSVGSLSHTSSSIHYKLMRKLIRRSSLLIIMTEAIASWVESLPIRPAQMVVCATLYASKYGSRDR